VSRLFGFRVWSHGCESLTYSILLLQVDSDDSSDEDSMVNMYQERDDPNEKRTRRADKLAASLLKKKDRRDWESQRSQLLFNYTKHNYFGAPVRLVSLLVYVSLVSYLH